MYLDIFFICVKLFHEQNQTEVVNQGCQTSRKEEIDQRFMRQTWGSAAIITEMITFDLSVDPLLTKMIS
jgi:hypothetical protein